MVTKTTKQKSQMDKKKWAKDLQGLEEDLKAKINLD